MDRRHLLAPLGLALLGAATGRAAAQVAGTSTVGVAVEEVDRVARGWSVKRRLLGAVVVNDSGERVGTIDDLIVSPPHTLGYAIIGAGGFLGIDRHDVAVPVDRLRFELNGRVLFPGATRAAVRDMPAFEYARG